MRQRGNSYLEREAHGDKPVLAFDYDLVADGRKFQRPVNYALVRIRPPQNYPIQNDSARPFVIIDPRAGHGSGIGGFKPELEVGVALRDGHPVYFACVLRATGTGPDARRRLRGGSEVLRTHRERHSKIGRAARDRQLPRRLGGDDPRRHHPDLTGPIVIAGAPLSYWSGAFGKNPLRYFGGLGGGAVPASLAADLGAGKFDGAGLVSISSSSTRPRRGGGNITTCFPTSMGKRKTFSRSRNGGPASISSSESEIRWIVENLFVGNKLTRGEAVLDDGQRIDLARIKAPIIAFASHGDNISPPQQALNWIPDLYSSVDEIRASGRVIIYTLHDSVGHLGIFVSDQVASREHRQITSVVDMVEALPPGLYELLIAERDGRPHVTFEAREIGDILALGDGRQADAGFAAAAKISELSTAAYEQTLRPFVQAFATPAFAQSLSALHPVRSASISSPIAIPWRRLLPPGRTPSAPIANRLLPIIRSCEWNGCNAHHRAVVEPVPRHPRCHVAFHSTPFTACR